MSFIPQPPGDGEANAGLPVEKGGRSPRRFNIPSPLTGPGQPAALNCRAPSHDEERSQHKTAPSPDFRKRESCRTMPLVGRFFSGIFRFPRLLHSGTAPYSLQSLSSALKTSLLRATLISSLHSFWANRRRGEGNQTDPPSLITNPSSYKLPPPPLSTRGGVSVSRGAFFPFCGIGASLAGTFFDRKD
ncbi:hypothetical protein PR048_023022 [Dryococelus australis]|uniref:Uncharacterized protein n=1 Tax=Dryococelus australis TaxID=614101 RepID=A0ABQ9GT05_9NEOP|nr:hypothetical protein PR048_023022 [Dryococelus australis]